VQNLTTSILPQEIPATDISVEKYLETFAFSELERQMALCLEDSDRLQEWERLHERYIMLGGYQQIPLEKLFHGLQLEKSLLQCSMKELSSGQRMRIALAKAVQVNSDLLLLDEPTNHLDSTMRSWLTRLLQERKGGYKWLRF